jgi:Rod binding domain-containing protein
MDFVKSIVSLPDLAANVAGTSAAAEKLNEDKREKLAKDFESVFIYRLLMEMNNATGEWGMEEDQTSEQVQSLFSLCLSDHISKNGGVGLWKDIKKTLDEAADKDSGLKAMEMKI